MNRFLNLLLLSLVSFNFFAFANENKAVISEFTGEVFNVSVMSEVEANDLFSSLKNNKFIDFEVVADGYSPRAYLMIVTARLKNINMGKIVVDVLNRTEEVIEIPVTGKTWKIRLYYHVAPMVYVRNSMNGAIEERIIDPALFNKPISRPEYISELSKNPLVKLNDFLLPPLVSDKLQTTTDVRIGKLDRNMLTIMNDAKSFTNQFGQYLEKAPLMDNVQQKCFQGGLERPIEECT